MLSVFFFFFQAEDGIRDLTVTGVQTCALPIFVETDAVNKAGMKQHFHRLRLHAAEEKLGAFTMKFFKRNLKRVQPGSINGRHGTHSKNHDARYAQSAREGGFEFLRHAEEKWTVDP